MTEAHDAWQELLRRATESTFAGITVETDDLVDGDDLREAQINPNAAGGKDKGAGQGMMPPMMMGGAGAGAGAGAAPAAGVGAAGAGPVGMGAAGLGATGLGAAGMGASGAAGGLGAAGLGAGSAGLGAGLRGAGLGGPAGGGGVLAAGGDGLPTPTPWTPGDSSMPDGFDAHDGNSPLAPPELRSPRFVGPSLPSPQPTAPGIDPPSRFPDTRPPSYEAPSPDISTPHVPAPPRTGQLAPDGVELGDPSISDAPPSAGTPLPPGGPSGPVGPSVPSGPTVSDGPTTTGAPMGPGAPTGPGGPDTSFTVQSNGLRDMAKQWEAHSDLMGSLQSQLTPPAELGFLADAGAAIEQLTSSIGDWSSGATKEFAHIAENLRQIADGYDENEAAGAAQSTQFEETI